MTNSECDGTEINTTDKTYGERMGRAKHLKLNSIIHTLTLGKEKTLMNNVMFAHIKIYWAGGLNEI